MKLPSLCNATKAEPITFPEKLSFFALTHLCKTLGSKVFVIESHASQQQALEVTEHIDCVHEEYPEYGRFQSDR